jgi:hypothetical protein
MKKAIIPIIIIIFILLVVALWPKGRIEQVARKTNLKIPVKQGITHLSVSDKPSEITNAIIQYETANKVVGVDQEQEVTLENTNLGTCLRGLSLDGSENPYVLVTYIHVIKGTAILCLRDATGSQVYHEVFKPGEPI